MSGEREWLAQEKIDAEVKRVRAKKARQEAGQVPRSENTWPLAWMYARNTLQHAKQDSLFTAMCLNGRRLVGDW